MTAAGARAASETDDPRAATARLLEHVLQRVMDMAHDPFDDRLVQLSLLPK